MVEWKNAPDLSTPLDADHLNQYSVDLTSIADAADASATAAAASAALAAAPTDAAMAAAVANPASDTSVSLSSTLLMQGQDGLVWVATKNGVIADGVTDDTAAWNALFVTVQNAGGGAIFLPGGRTSLCLGALTPMPWMTTCPSLRIFGAGAYINGGGDGGVRGTSKLDLRYAGTTNPAKIDSRGDGVLEIDHLTIISGGTDNWPILKTTNTTLRIHDNHFAGNQANTGSACVQDVLILGGLAPITDLGSSSTAAFFGYGTVISDNSFANIRRAIYGGDDCEALILGNFVTRSCGGDATHGAMDFNGTIIGNTQANLLIGNRFEITHYVYAHIFTDAQNNMGYGNKYWDVDFALWLGVTKNIGGSRGNVFLGTYGPYVQGNATTESPGMYGEVASGSWSFGGPNNTSGVALVSLQPLVPPAVGTAAMLTVNRALTETVNPGLQNLLINYNGNVISKGAIASGSITLDQYNNIISTGNIKISCSSDDSPIRAVVGMFRDRTFTTATRRIASITGAGSCYFDTTLNKPVWSDGTNWRDAMGTIV